MENHELSKLPSVDALVRAAREASEKSEIAGARWAHPTAVRVAREILAKARERAQRGEAGDPATLAPLLRRELDALDAGLRRVINATGVLLHTNLGRAPLGRAVLGDLQSVLGGYCDLEFDLGRGERGARGARVDRLLTILTGAPAAGVVQNGAAAVFLALAALARGKDVLVSRGELVQIGGGFRLPDIFLESGARLVEVGTTNITRVGDYARAITEATGAILQVHQSCYRIEGHVEKASTRELAALARERGLPLLVDLGGGNLSHAAIDDVEPLVGRVLGAGPALTMFSGDKMFGAAQAGIILGETRWLAPLKSSPLWRVLRPSKLELFVLESVVRTRLRGGQTVLDALATAPAEQIRRRAESLRSRVAALPLTIAPGTSTLGGGTSPGATLPTFLIEWKTTDADRLYRRLLARPVPIVARVDADAVRFDLRSVLDEDEADLESGLREVG